MKKVEFDGGGNFFDKYRSRNPLAKALVSGFFRQLDHFIDEIKPKTAFEIGCGEGALLEHLYRKNIRVGGFDLSQRVISAAELRFEKLGHRFDKAELFVGDIYKQDKQPYRCDLLLLCEVLEHLEDPETALEMISLMKFKHLIVSVPREPLWRTLNMARGAYWRDFGNTPGHIQHFSTSLIKQKISKYFEISAVATPVPWTMILCRKKMVVKV